MMFTGGQIVCESLIREGVEVIFGIPGGAILPLYQDLPSIPNCGIYSCATSRAQPMPPTATPG